MHCSVYLTFHHIYVVCLFPVQQLICKWANVV